MKDDRTFFVHEQGLCETTHVGAGTRIWAFAHVLPGATIGRDCNICDHVFIENGVTLGDRVTVKCGVQLWDGVRVGDDVFIGPNATFCNDKFPRSKQYPESFLPIVLEKGASVGANATLLPGITVGEGAMIGAGAVVNRNVPPYAVVYGNPARIRDYRSEWVSGKSVGVTNLPSAEAAGKGRTPVDLGVGGCALLPLPSFRDLRGDLTAVEFAADVPFVPRRQFFVYRVSGGEVRGEHAHRECQQLLVAVHGSVHVVINDGRSMKEVCLDRPDWGLHLKPGVWGIQYKFSSDAVLGVYASHPYDNNDYIRNFHLFLAEYGPKAEHPV